VRPVVDNQLVSPEHPALRMRVDPGLPYLGATELEIKGLAWAERHHFVEHRDGHVRRMLVVQFEGFLPTTDEVYRYPLPDPVTLGGDTWGTWVFGYAVAHSTAPETADTGRFLADRRLALDDEQIMARFARILGKDARHEILIFYHEPLGRLGYSLGSIFDGDVIPPVYASVATELKARARRAFTLLPLETLAG
jgi:hypothetical protein